MQYRTVSFEKRLIQLSRAEEDAAITIPVASREKNQFANMRSLVLGCFQQQLGMGRRLRVQSIMSFHEAVTALVLADLKKYRDRQQAVEIIYLNKRGQTSRRIIRILLLDEDKGQLKAYCYTRKACRVFAIAGILALAPVAGQFVG
ncbi:hypothetical protein BAG01nite_12310 [Brevibacillus agri]|uniref:WYL domain-containing protein n=2 Tax=Brevibacillus TaxID=55080 RepID=A0A3M8AJ15_9BACL|nr:hypothetical protein PMI08_04453 [Brevibacillus sp. CF112]ELK39590.1 hypothetical protein D478_23588 [Brevibacillus agri BAB-2500]MBG9565523.1 hypothetical protein [Brevibacillus agri]QHZ55430.1 hypothetical protein M655_007100 [Brevibacillus sp. NSP2.1]MBY0051980.1 hypothetical protein [Brevibacillus agri]